MERYDAPLRVESADQLLPLARELADRDAAQIQADPAYAVTCTAGCGACCSQAVPVTRAEVRAIQDYVGGLGQDERDHIGASIEATAATLASHGITATNVDDERAYFDLGIPCPLLHEGSCSVRPVRPVACREYLVTSDPIHCATREDGQIVRISATNDLVHGYQRVSERLGEPDVLTLAPALAQGQQPAPPAVPAKSGAAMIRLLRSTPRR